MSETPTSARAEIRAAIDAAGGAIPFERFMEVALYGPSGFYTRGGRAGRRGDFLTAPEVGPLFGAVLVRFLDAEWERLGRPAPFTVVDAGAGRGTLARAVFAAAPVCAGAMQYVAVERSASQRAVHPAAVVSRADLPDQPFVGVVVANELLDNLPFRLAVYDDGWREAMVVAARDGSFAEVLGPPIDTQPGVLPDWPPRGARAPLQDQAAAWVRQARALVQRGSVLVIDYARPTTLQLAVLPWRDWLRTYRGHARGGHYLAHAGEQDITAELALDQLPAPDALRTQAQWLQRWGIDELVTEGRGAWTAAASAPTLDALRMRSRVAEAEALLDPAGLGAFLVAEWRA